MRCDLDTCHACDTFETGCSAKTCVESADAVVRHFCSRLSRMASQGNPQARLHFTRTYAHLGLTTEQWDTVWPRLHLAKPDPHGRIDHDITNELRGRPRYFNPNPTLAALESMYREYHSGLVGYCRLHFPAHDPEEIAQEAWIRFARAYDPARGQPRALLFRIATNWQTDKHRKATRRAEGGGAGVSASTTRLPWETAFAPVDLPEPADISPEPAQVAEKTEQQLVLLSALRSLTNSNQQSAIYLAYFENWETAEIATLLGITTGAVRNLFIRGLPKLGTYLADIGYIDRDDEGGVA